MSQAPLLAALAETVKLIGPGVPETVRLCAAGAAPPAICPKVSDAGAAEIVPADTVKVTGTIAGLLPAPGDVTVILPG